MTAETCQICGKTKNVNAAGHCQGHDNPSSSKQRLDAIRSAGASGRTVVTEEAPGLSLKEQLDAIPAPAATGAPAPAAAPPLGAAGVKKGPGSILGRKTGAGTDDISGLKSQLDAIPAPAAGATAEPASVPKDLLDSIPTPGAGRGPDADIPKSALDSIPSPGGGAAAAPLSGASLADQLNSIPTPAVASGPAAPEKPQGEVPEWMRNFEKHQSAISASIAAQGGQAPANAGGYGAGGGAYATPDMVPASYGSSRGGADAPPQGSAYTMVIGIVIIICLAMFGYLMISKPAPPVMPADPSMTTPASSMPSTPMTTPTPVPNTQMPQGMPTPVPGSPQGLPTPVPGSPQGFATPVPGSPQGFATPVPGSPQGLPPGAPGLNPGGMPTSTPQTGNNPVTPTGNNP